MSVTFRNRRLRPTARLCLVFISLAGLSLSAWQGYQLYRQLGPVSGFVIDEARTRAELLAASNSAITADYLNTRVADLVDACDLETAASYVAVGEAQNLRLRPDVREAFRQADEWPARGLCLAEQAGTGFLTGEGHTAGHIGGAVASDLLVYGDLRDIAVQSYNFSTGADVDEFILTISGIGLAATAGTYLSGGTGTPARVAVSLVKIAKRTGRLTSRFAAYIGTGLKRIMPADKVVAIYRSSALIDLPKALLKGADQAELAKLGRTFDDLGTISRTGGNAAALRLLKHVETPKDLEKLATVARIGGKRTLAWTDRFGAGLLKMVKPIAKFTARTAAEIVALVFSALLAMLAALLGFGTKRVALFGIRRLPVLYQPA